MEKLIIIGSGPAGLSAAIYAARAQLNPLLVVGPISGGQLTMTTEVENYPGFVQGILGTKLMADFKNQAERFGTRFLAEEVVSVTKETDFLTVRTASQSIYQAKTVLVATGANARWLNLKSETRLRGKGVSACATCDGFFFRDKLVAIVGGGDTAMEEANFLTKFVKQVYLIHRRDSFRASKIMQERTLNNSKIKVIYNASVEEILGTDKVTGLKLKIIQNSKETKIETLAIDGLFVAIGHQPATAFLKDSGVFLDDKGYIFTSAKIAIAKMRQNKIPTGQYNFTYQYMTNIPGLFASGDCVDHEYRQAGVAVGMGIAAELEVEKYLNEQNA